MRYEVALEHVVDAELVEIRAETVLLCRSEDWKRQSPQIDLFPRNALPPKTILLGTKGAKTRTVINKVPGGNDNFYSETYRSRGKGWAPTF